MDNNNTNIPDPNTPVVQPEKTELETLENETVEDTNSETDSLKQKYDELENRYKRLAAEKANEIRQFESQKVFLTENLLKQIIDIKDDLEVVVNQIPENEKESTGSMGAGMGYGKLMILLMSNGVNEIQTEEGDDFEPSRHEAVTVEENEEKKNKIVKILRKGYMLRERVLRPVKVIVGR